GYRVDSDDHPMFLGDPLRNDLVSLIAVVSRTLGLSGKNMLSVQEVADLFAVSKRTISRLRKEGLVFHWVVDQDGRRRIGCNKLTAEHFLSKNKRRLSSASGFSQLTREEQASVIDAAMSYSGSDLTLNALANELAKKKHRGLETIRLLLKNSDQAKSVFKHHPPLTRHDARVIQRATRLGVQWKTMQNHYKRTIPALRRAVLRMRATDLRADKIQYVEMPSFSRDDAAEVILGVEVIRNTITPQLLLTIETASSSSMLSESDEMATVSAMHLLCYRASNMIESLGYSPTAASLDRIETDLRWVFLLQQKLTMSALSAGLAVFVQHVGRPLSELPQLQCIDLTRRAIAFIWDILSTIDPSRGQKVNRVAVAYIDRMLSQERSLARPSQASANRESASLSLPFHNLVSWTRLLPRKEPEFFPSPVQKIQEMRFGWIGNPKTIEEIATILGCSEAIVLRQLKKR
ncbi:MAG: helix-turn-helix domain-containing protein, partial [Phycisphaerales bacterium]|nr:helix-turn-helix domain-containing protein [Phycisphaerales bacterium]